MELKIDYYIKRKSDNKLIQILHTTFTEDEIIEAVKQKLTAPINYNMEDDEGNGDYVFSDITIDEVTGLH